MAIEGTVDFIERVWTSQSGNRCAKYTSGGVTYLAMKEAAERVEQGGEGATVSFTPKPAKREGDDPVVFQLKVVKAGKPNPSTGSGQPNRAPAPPYAVNEEDRDNRIKWGESWKLATMLYTNGLVKKPDPITPDAVADVIRTYANAFFNQIHRGPAILTAKPPVTEESDPQ